MTFQDFLNKTGYSAAYAASRLLYFPKSRPVKLAESLGYSPTELEKKMLVKLASGKPVDEVLKQAS